MMKLILFMISILLLIKNFKFMKLILQNYLFLFMFLMLLNLSLNNFYWSKIYYIYSIDSISINLMMLTCWIISLALLSSNNILFLKFNYNFMFMIMILMLLLMLLFMSMNMLMFYIYFEVSLIPIMLMIFGWGMQVNRIQASMYMLFYTLFGSLPLFIMILYMYIKFNTLMFNILILNNNLYLNNMFFYFMLIMAFLIKMPMYFVHLWLPKAHVEAPISGSMILAGIMLKLGSYGLYRMMLIYPLMFKSMNFMIISVSILGSLYASLICLNNIDMKVIVAYSSVVHMGTLMASMMTLTNWGFMGSFLMMLAHGLSSSSLFSLVNFNYERINSRMLLINKGLMNIMPSITLLWFLMCITNFSAPPSMNLFSEMMLFNSLIIWCKFNMFLLFIIAFMSTCYSIYIYSFTQYNKMNLNLFNFKFINCREFMIILLHWIPLNFFFLNMNILL